jgi:hypothetical protein
MDPIKDVKAPEVKVTPIATPLSTPEIKPAPAQAAEIKASSAVAGVKVENKEAGFPSKA